VTAAPHSGQNMASLGIVALQALHEYNALPQNSQKLASGVSRPQVGQRMLRLIPVKKIQCVLCRVNGGNMRRRLKLLELD
jgi:hypothetical protein